MLHLIVKFTGEKKDKILNYGFNLANVETFDVEYKKEKHEGNEVEVFQNIKLIFPSGQVRTYNGTEGKKLLDYLSMNAIHQTRL